MKYQLTRPPEKMSRHQRLTLRTAFLGVALACLFAAKAAATPNFTPAPSSYHTYIDEKLVLTLELTPKKEIFIDVINMGDSRRCMSIENLVARTANGVPLKFDSFLYDGTVSKTDGGPRACVVPRARRQWELGYSFPFSEQVRRVFVLMGDNMYRLEPMSRTEFADFKASCDKINLGVASQQLKMFNLRVLFGRNVYGSVTRYRRVAASVSSAGTRGPVTLFSSIPPQTEQAFRKKRGGEVTLKIKVNARGEVTEATPENQLEYGLTERAVYEVMNWWDFAPAVEDGKPVDGEHTVTVVYRVAEDEEDEEY